MRTRLLITIVFLAAIAICMGAATTIATPESLWKSVGTITESQTTPAVDARDYSSVWTDLSAAKTVKWDVHPDTTGIELRFQTTANADAHVVEMWVASGATYSGGTSEESFMLAGVLTLTGGQQVGPNSNVYVDTITRTDHTIGTSVITDSGNDRVAVYRADLRGYKKVVFIATTLEASSTLYVDARSY